MVTIHMKDGRVSYSIPLDGKKGTITLDTGSDAININPSAGSPSGSTNGGVLDLGNGDMIVQDTYASDVEPLLEAGYDDGAWDGISPTGGTNPAAIISSGAASDPYGIESLVDHSI